MRGKNHRPPDAASRPQMCDRNDLLGRLSRSRQHRHLRAIARKLIEMAAGGGLQTIKELGDRLDGKCAPVFVSNR